MGWFISFDGPPPLFNRGQELPSLPISQQDQTPEVCTDSGLRLIMCRQPLDTRSLFSSQGLYLQTCIVKGNTPQVNCANFRKLISKNILDKNSTNSEKSLKSML